MQEEVEQKTFNIVVSTTKLTARTILNAGKAAIQQQQAKMAGGKQSVRMLLRQNRGVSSVEIDKTNIRGFERYAKKYGIRIIPMIDEVFDAFLEEYQYQKVIGFCTDEIDGYSGFVFCTGDGKVYLPNAINRTIRSICAGYNKEEESKAKEENRDPVLLPKFSCHILRHTFCTRFCENETNLKVIQEIMGHADISTTMDVYAEATQEKKKESMASLQSALLVR